MTVLIDTNVILDVLLQRQQFLQASSGVILLSEKNIVEGMVIPQFLLFILSIF